MSRRPTAALLAAAAVLTLSYGVSSAVRPDDGGRAHPGGVLAANSWSVTQAANSWSTEQAANSWSATPAANSWSTKQTANSWSATPAANSWSRTGPGAAPPGALAT